MDTELPVSSIGTSHEPEPGGVSGVSQRRLSGLLAGFILLLLAALVVVPTVIGRRTDALRDRRLELVYPAQHALQESRSLLTEQLAAVRGYQITGETVYLTRLQDALVRQRPATDQLMRLASRLGPETLASVQEIQARITEWQEAPRAMLAGTITRDQLVASLPVGQQRFEAALATADEARAALNRSEAQLERRIRTNARLEQVLTILLSLGALAAGLMMIWLTRRLQKVTEQLEARAEKLRVSEERFRLIAENLRELIWISDPGYTVQYYLSPAYERIWGRSMAEARSNPRSFLQAVVPEDRERVETALEAYARGEYTAEYRIARPDGEIRWISGRAYPVRDEHGTIFLMAGIAEDITAQKHAEQERERLLERERHAHAKTEAALHLRDRVVQIVSHDLKNPLHTIGMAAQLLEMPLSEEQRSKQIAVIRRTVARANRMVGDLLDAARLQSGRAIAVARDPLPVQPLLAEAVEAFRFQADQKNQQLTCEVPGEIPPVLGDHDRLIQALSNLLGNAVKFTPEGGRILLGAQVDADGAVRFYVSDTGPGIAPELLPDLFEPFTQARDTASLGTGLGLAITRGIVEAHGGAISAQSEPGTGTTFTFTLPGRAPDSQRDAESPETEAMMTDRKRRKIDPRAKPDSVEADPEDQKVAPPKPHAPLRYPDPVDDALDDSFPASDPPPWWGR